MIIDKFIFLDANAFYEYLGRDILFNSSTQLDIVNYKADLDEYKYKYIPSSVFTEIIVHFRNDLEKIQKIFYFIADKELKIVPVGVKRYTTDELMSFVKTNKKKKLEFLNNELKEKIDTEFGFSYVFILAISLVYGLYLGKKNNLNLASFSKVYGKFIHDRYYIEDEKTIKNELKAGYNKKKEIKALKDAFTKSIHRNFVLAHGLILNLINEGQEITDEILNRELDIVFQTIGEDSNEIMNIVKSTAEDNEFIAEAINEVPKYFLNRSYDTIQTDYIKEKLSSWLKDGQKLIKNDIYDILFFGCLSRTMKESISDITSRNISLNNIIAVSFDKKVLEHVKKYSVESYNFCVKYAPHLE